MDRKPVATPYSQKALQHKLSLSVEEAAEATGIGRSKLYTAMKDGLLPARMFGRRRVILRDDLERFLTTLPLAA